MNEFYRLREQVRNVFDIKADKNYHRNWKDVNQNTEAFINLYGKI